MIIKSLEIVHNLKRYQILHLFEFIEISIDDYKIKIIMIIKIFNININVKNYNIKYLM